MLFQTSNAPGLTKRHHSLAVVWIAATLGSKHSFKKLSKKQVNGVNLLNACEYLSAPPEPMSLRITSNLMVGVARVYSQQTNFFYADVSHVMMELKRVLFQFQTGDIDMPVSIVKQDMITMERPDFVPEVLTMGDHLLQGLTHPHWAVPMTPVDSAESQERRNKRKRDTLLENARLPLMELNMLGGSFHDTPTKSHFSASLRNASLLDGGLGINLGAPSVSATDITHDPLAPPNWDTIPQEEQLDLFGDLTQEPRQHENLFFDFDDNVDLGPYPSPPHQPLEPFSDTHEGGAQLKADEEAPQAKKSKRMKHGSKKSYHDTNISLAESDFLVMRQRAEEPWNKIYTTLYHQNQDRRCTVMLGLLKKGIPSAVPLYLTEYWNNAIRMPSPHGREAHEGRDGAEVGGDYENPSFELMNYEGVDLGPLDIDYDQPFEMNRDLPSVERNRSPEPAKDLPWRIASVAGSSTQTKGSSHFGPVSSETGFTPIRGRMGSVGSASKVDQSIDGPLFDSNDFMLEGKLDKKEPNIHGFFRYVHGIMDQAGTDFVYLSDILEHNESRVAAADAFFSILSLATRQAIRVRQDKPFGDICLLKTEA